MRRGPGLGRADGGGGTRVSACLGRVGASVTSAGRERLPGASSGVWAPPARPAAGVAPPGAEGSELWAGPAGAGRRRDRGGG